MTPETSEAARRAFANFSAGLGGDAAAMARFVDEMDDEVVLFFPAGPKHDPPYVGKERIRAFFANVTAYFANGLHIVLDRELVSEDSVAFQFHDDAVRQDGTTYTNTIIIVLTMRDGRVVRYREYFGGPWSDTIPPV